MGIIALIYRRRAWVMGESPRRKEAVEIELVHLDRKQWRIRRLISGAGAVGAECRVQCPSERECTPKATSQPGPEATSTLFIHGPTASSPLLNLPGKNKTTREVNIQSASSQARPAPKPRPTQAGQARRLKRRTEKTTPKERPREDLMIMEEMARSHCRIAVQTLAEVFSIWGF